MTDIKAWIAEHRAIHAAAKDGPWSYIQDTRLDGLPVYRVGSEKTGEDILSIPRYRHNEDGVDIADAVTDAHNITVPTALSMIEAVLELAGQLDAEAEDSASISLKFQRRETASAIRSALEGVVDGE